MSVDGDGTWRNDSGGELSYLAGHIGVDMTRTPATKTLLVRRLALEVGESADVKVVHIMVPGLRLERRRQRYTRVSECCYRGEGPDSTVSHHGDEPVPSAVHEFEVDEDGLVVDWPGHFRRAWTFDRHDAVRRAEKIYDRRQQERGLARDDENGAS